MKRGRKKTDKFASLPEEWRTKVLSAKEDVLNKELRTVVLNMMALASAKEMDMHLKELQEQAKQAGELYKQGAKDSKLKIEFIIEMMRAQGIDVPDWQTFAKADSVEDNS